MKKIEAIIRTVGIAEDSKRELRNASLTVVSVCKSLRKRYATLPERVSHDGEVPPQTLPNTARFDSTGSKAFVTGRRNAKMALALQVLSSHVLGVLDIESALSMEPALVSRLVRHAASETEALKHSNFPRLFLLDGCSINLPLGPLSARLRANSPGSKFLALLPPDRSTESEMILLFYWGIDGFVTLQNKWKTELPKAVAAISQDRFWVPSGVLLTFVRQMKTVLDKQLTGGQSLTARESQVLQLLFRRLTNKEIACQLNISERTAKFHVSNVLGKLGLEKRGHLLVSAAVN